MYEDRWISVSLIFIMLIHLAVWILGYLTNKLSYLISVLNLAVAITLIVYWMINQIRIQQHTIEAREIIVFFFEIIVAISAAYNIAFINRYHLLTIFQYIIFGIDIIVLIAALIFMLTFKMTKLF